MKRKKLKWKKVYPRTKLVQQGIKSFNKTRQKWERNLQFPAWFLYFPQPTRPNSRMKKMNKSTVNLGLSGGKGKRLRKRLKEKLKKSINSCPLNPLHFTSCFERLYQNWYKMGTNESGFEGDALNDIGVGVQSNRNEKLNIKNMRDIAKGIRVKEEK